MKRVRLVQFSVLFLSILLALSLNAIGETRSYDLSNFSKVSAGWGMNVEIVESADYLVEVTADSRVFDDLKVERHGHTLEFSMKSSGWFGWVRSHDSIQIRVEMPELTGIGLSGGAEASVRMGETSQEFSADLSGGATLKGEIRCGDIEVNTSGGSEVELTGRGRNLELHGSGGSEIHLENFSVADVRAHLSGGAEAGVRFSGILEADQSGGSEITYYGSGKVGSINSSGGSTVRQGS